MRFTTLTFLLFFIAFYFAYWALPSRRRLVLIVIGSLVFYAAWSIPFAVHFFLIVAINHWLVTKLFHRPRRVLLWTILLLDIANLFAFKYFYLFLRSLFDLGALFSSLAGINPFAALHPESFNSSLEATLGIPGIVLPLAISFYTFQLMAFAVDVYRGRIDEPVPFLDFAVFILFFPQLVAGPIMRHSDFFHQLHGNRASEEQTLSGMHLLMLGIIKKVLIADNILPVIDPVFRSPEQFDWQTNAAAAVGFSIRVYCDFSGYTDIARGLGKLLGLDLPENFRAPYLATSFREVWQRWHITLSTWIRDYLYIPLGGSRQTETRNFVTIFVSFTLAGLWHGAAYHYIVWGAGHGFLLALERVLRRKREQLAERLDRQDRAWWQRGRTLWASTPIRFIRKAWMVAVIFFVWNVFAIAFNAPSMKEAVVMWQQIFTLAGGTRTPQMDFLGAMFVVGMLLNWLQLKQDWQGFPRLLRYAAALLLAGATILLLGRFSPEGSDFIYFQF